MVKQFIEVTNSKTNLKRLINVDNIKSVIEENNGTAFIEFYDSSFKSVYGFSCVEGYEKVKCMLVDFWR